ncbi:bifunctional histidinol-phosphatase/imidazoleglycerol-phosphate dehydratase HisB [Legionella spiritensis]|uniref:Histidine biosynthesis bifunctional protein HisB n=1 Tax=Legionella spiritensis TaxID=452 RepID=A0A0W0Z6R9_LEGSP|nr:bifunctional histidinol-phosphatase/imidazoleglycerol-phosphate dehydratase HisB [Legionella spiritensis]KTD64818.1 imidazole glycerol-phosphate dehydratase/histidinol phosphatase [Legionella spiritensis]SNV40392.1 histidinol-phosphatase [Legionella spiritensis]
MQKVLFIDRDGTLIEEPGDFQVDSLDKIRLIPHVIPSLLALSKAGYKLVMVSNQDGLGTSDFPECDFKSCHDFILTLFQSQGIAFSEVFICPHRADEGCRCRKPKTGLLDAFMTENDLDKNNSLVIGDRTTDEELANNLGVSFLPINARHGWQDIVSYLLKPVRKARVQRHTRETQIDMAIELDCEQNSRITTPIAFFSHMLEQIARHGGFYLDIEARGDTEVDEHHLIEDTALTLGEVLKQALGDKLGIARYGFTLPMDESLASVAIDLGGRPYCRFDAPFTREYVGGLATEMIPHFFHSLANALGAGIHVSVTGQNHHHMIEACFKALGKTLSQASARQGNELPSTKGVL